MSDRVDPKGYRKGFAIATSDTAPLTHDVDAIYIGGAGNLVYTPGGGGSDITLNNVVAGTIVPVEATFVKSTGTTATNMVGLYYN